MFQLKELMQYIMILVVFLLAYGISILAVQYTHREFDGKILYRDIFYYPFWQMYGELFLEELEGKFNINYRLGAL
jgi:transient receptor potential cation channel subfamily M protein 2